mgnify:CR=1 FL=1
MTIDNTTAIVEVNSETDFVAKNETFKAFVKGILKVIVEKKPTTVEELKALPYDDNFATVELKLKDMIFTIGENMNLRRFERFEGVNEAYIHGGGRIGVLVNFKLGDESKANEPLPHPK